MINIIIAILQLVLVTGLVLFWIIFFKTTNKSADKSEIYLTHERSFPIPDLGLIAPTLVISAIGLLIGNSIGIFFTILSAGALYFLGLIDLAFNVNARKGDYKSKEDQMTSYIIISLVLTLATINLIYGLIEFNNMCILF